jgi:hypothetical protein
MHSEYRMDGHDAPVQEKEQDYYDRWTVARSISRIIEEAPLEWSTRIGLTGPWGEGKSSVLNFLEQQQRSAGSIVLRYAPWGAATPEEVWKEFGQVLLDGLKANRVKVSVVQRIKNRIKRIGTAKVAGGIQGAGKIAELTLNAPGAAIGAEVASQAITEKLKFTKTDILKLLAQVGRRRVVVFIDDLDRSDPSVIPKLLLALRELLDMPQFAFVLAFDKGIVATSLEISNASWAKSGNNFLDKVLDFYVDLPAPTLPQITRFAKAQFAQLCQFVPLQEIDAIADLLPANPRKMKLLTRTVASMRQEVERHEVDELNWHVILLVSLIRAESADLANVLMPLARVSSEDFSSFLRTSSEEQQLEAAYIKEMLDKFPELEVNRERNSRIISAWIRLISKQNDERIRYQAQFAWNPDCITWGEYKQFFATWRKRKSLESIDSFIRERTRATESRYERVRAEFHQTVLGHYSTILETATEVGTAYEHSELMEQAEDSLQLLVKVLAQNVHQPDLPMSELRELWERLLAIAIQWIHFASNAKEPQLRDSEALALIALGERLADNAFLVHKINDQQRSVRKQSVFGSVQARALCQRLMTHFAQGAGIEALQVIATPGALTAIVQSDDQQGIKYLLTSPMSPLYGNLKPSLMECLAKRKATKLQVSDAKEFLEWHLLSLNHLDPASRTHEARAQFIDAHQDFFALLWDLSTSVPSQYRMLESLRDMRAKLIALGMQEASLPVPAWLIESQPASPETTKTDESGDTCHTNSAE